MSYFGRFRTCLDTYTAPGPKSSTADMTFETSGYSSLFLVTSLSALVDDSIYSLVSFTLNSFVFNSRHNTVSSTTHHLLWITSCNPFLHSCSCAAVWCISQRQMQSELEVASGKHLVQCSSPNRANLSCSGPYSAEYCVSPKINSLPPLWANCSAI